MDVNNNMFDLNGESSKTTVVNGIPYVVKRKDGHKNIFLVKQADNAVTECTVYVPDNITSSTGVHIHADGSGVGTAETVVPRILERVSGKQIVVMPIANYATKNWGDIGAGISDAIIDNQHLTNGNVSFSGWSGGSGNAIQSVVKFYEANPNMNKNPNIFFLDEISDLTKAIA